MELKQCAGSWLLLEVNIVLLPSEREASAGCGRRVRVRG